MRSRMINHTPPKGSRLKRSRQQADDQRPKLICPFYKRAPSKYCNSRACVGPGWESVARVKEHLERSHMLPPNQCSRCFLSFGSGSLLEHHQHAELPCEAREKPSLDGIDADTWSKIKKKSRYKAQSEPERWADVYRILFPGSEVPSPHTEDCQPPSDVLEYEAHLRSSLPEMVHQGIQNTFGGTVSKEFIQTLIHQSMDRVNATFRIRGSLKPSPTDVTSIPSEPALSSNTSLFNSSSTSIAEYQSQSSGQGNSSFFEMDTLQSRPSEVPTWSGTSSFDFMGDDSMGIFDMEIFGMAPHNMGSRNTGAYDTETHDMGTYDAIQ